MSLVSVIIPNYNCSRWLSATLDSCLAQNNYLKEIIVIDDGSQDSSLEILNDYVRRYPFVKVFPNRQKGGNAARNSGFELSSGDYIQWLDADDQLLPGKFEVQIKALKESNSDIAYSDWKQVFTNDQQQVINTELKKKSAYNDFLYEILADNWSPPCSYLLTRKAALAVNKCKGWNTETKISQDREYFSKAAIIGLKFVYAPGILSVYNTWTNHSVSRKLTQQERAMNVCSLLESLKEFISEQEWLKEDNKNRYYRVLNGQILSLSVANQIQVNVDLLKRKGISWKQIKGFRTKLKAIREFYFRSLFIA